MELAITQIAIWSLVGISGSLYWWTFKNDLTADIILITTVLLSGVLGPLTWIMGAIIYSPSTHRIIIKRRGR